MSKQKEYIIEGMSCASCAMTVENAVSKMPGVNKASVNLATEIMTVEANDSVTPEDIAKVVDGVGYGARPRGKSVEEELEEKNEKKEAHLREMKRNLTISAYFHCATSLYRNGGYGWNSNAILSKPNAKSS